MIGVDKLVHKRARTLEGARAHSRNFVNDIVDVSSVRNSVIVVGYGCRSRDTLRLFGIEKNILWQWEWCLWATVTQQNNSAYFYKGGRYVARRNDAPAEDVRLWGSSHGRIV